MPSKSCPLPANAPRPDLSPPVDSACSSYPNRLVQPGQSCPNDLVAVRRDGGLVNATWQARNSLRGAGEERPQHDVVARFAQPSNQRPTAVPALRPPTCLPPPARRRRATTDSGPLNGCGRLPQFWQAVVPRRFTPLDSDPLPGHGRGFMCARPTAATPSQCDPYHIRIAASGLRRFERDGDDVGRFGGGPRRGRTVLVYRTPLFFSCLQKG